MIDHAWAHNVNITIARWKLSAAEAVLPIVEYSGMTVPGMLGFHGAMISVYEYAIQWNWEFVS